MNKKPQMKALALGLMLAIVSAQSAFAQSSTSSAVSGRVTDAEGQPVAGATVEILHVPSNTRRTVITDDQGRYGSSGLRVGGPFTVTVAKDGFRGAAADNVYLQLGEAAAVNLAVEDATTQLQSVEVVATAQSDIFRSDNFGTGTAIGSREIQAFPSVNRNIQDYVRLDPRIAQTDKSRNEISAGGQNTRYNAIRVDGISTSDTFGLESNSLPTPKQPISMDVIEAINVSIANYDVAIGGATGAVINAVTKSGGNDFSGSVYGTYRENDWSGKNASNVRPSIFDTDETYGATFGGALIKDRLFFFVNYEKSTFSAPGTNFGPTGSGASNIVPITTAQIQEVIDISRNVWGFDPGSLQIPDSLDTTGEEYGVKIDWNISDAHRAELRYGKSDQSQANVVGFGNNSLALSSYLYQRDFKFETISAQLFSDWSDVFSSEAKISYRDYSAVRTPVADLPAIAVRIGNATLNLGTEENTHANILETETWNASFVGNLFVGDHTVKFGIDYEQNDIYNLFGRRVNGVYTFNSIDLYRQGVSSRYQLFYPAGGVLDNIAASLRLDNTSLFLQDTWAVNYNLSLSMGVRVDIPDVPDAPAYNAAASNYAGFRNDATIDGYLVQPRVGVNYTFDTERATQLRGGFGLFQGAAASVWLSNPYANTGFNYTDYLFSTGITRFDPDRNDQLGLFTPGAGATQSVDFIDPDLKQPAVWKANLAFDHELPWWGIVASAEAVLTQVDQGIYYQQLNLGAPTAVGQDGRMIYWDANGRNPTRWNQSGTGTSVTARGNRNTAFNDLIIARATNKGFGEQLTLSLQKPYTENLFWQVAYTYTNAEEVSPLTSSTSSSQLGNVAVFQANEEVSARSNYMIRDRFSGAVAYRKFFFGDNKTEFSLFYEGRRGTPFSYTFDNDANGDGRLNDLLYIPSGPGDVMFGSAAEEAAFWEFVNGNEYLRSRLGQVAERNAEFNSWVHQFDVRISQEIPGFFPGNKAEIWLDVLNIGNMIDKEWGRVEQFGFPSMRGVVEYGGIDPATGRYVYRFNTPDAPNIYDDRGISRWALQVGFRYKF